MATIGATVLPPFNPTAGVPQGISQIAQAFLQRRQQRQSGQQFGSVFGPQFSGITNPNIQQFIAQQALQRQQGQQALTLQAAKPIPIETKAQIQAQEIRRLQAIPEARRTKGQKDSLKRLLEGQAAVQISFGKSTASERTAIAETQASLDSLDNLETLFDSAETVTGPIAGRVATTAGLFGKSTEKQEDFLAATFAFKNAIIKDITGAQMSEPEAKRIMKQIPDVNDPPVRWRAKARQTRRNLKELQKRRSEVLQRSGIVSPLEVPITGVPAPATRIFTGGLSGIEQTELDELNRLAGGR